MAHMHSIWYISIHIHIKAETFVQAHRKMKGQQYILRIAREVYLENISASMVSVTVVMPQMYILLH